MVITSLEPASNTSVKSIRAVSSLTMPQYKEMKKMNFKHLSMLLYCTYVSRTSVTVVFLL